jgi:hypothetical protein
MAKAGSERPMTHVLGVFSFPLTPNDDAKDQKWPNADLKESAGNLLSNYMGKALARNQKERR